MNAGPETLQNGGAAFATAHWSVVLAAQGRSAAAEEALEKICRSYWRPLYGFVRRQGTAPEEAGDLTQSFFARLLERRDLDAVRREKGVVRFGAKIFEREDRDAFLGENGRAGSIIVPVPAATALIFGR
ncbi:MAG: hypothetical protein ABIU29_12855 [Chthoniobacterales bacterium]